VFTAGRLQWTPDLHSLFVECVNELGGPANAVPSRILKLMGVEGLTLDHVKSHLFLYRRKQGSQQGEDTNDAAIAKMPVTHTEQARD